MVLLCTAVVIPFLEACLGSGWHISSALAYCGDGLVEPSEECDDGNLDDYDECDSNCTLPGCGNGILDSGEACDPGLGPNGACCTAACVFAAEHTSCGAVTRCAARECDGTGTCVVASIPCAPLVVDSTDDAPDASPGDDQCLTADGECTLRAAIQEANAEGGLNVILVPAGVYRLSLPDADANGEDLAETGDLDVTDDTVIEGAGADATIVDGNATTRVFDVLSGLTTLRGLTVANGAATDGAGVSVHDRARPILEDVVVRDNTATRRGGGVYLETSEATPDLPGPSLSVTRATFFHNVAAAEGGGISIYNGLDLFPLDGSIADSVFSENIGTNGGAVACARCWDPEGDGGFDLTVSRSAFDMNEASQTGGALFVGGLTLVDCVVSRNRAAGFGGGVFAAMRLGLRDSFRDNEALRSGGAFASGHGSIGIKWEECTVVGNVAGEYGGGIFGGDTYLLTNTTVSGNRAGRDGGGLFGNGIELNYSTVTDNVADADGDGEGDGGGVGCGSSPGLLTVAMANSILAGNHDVGEEAPDCGCRAFDLDDGYGFRGGQLFSFGYNLIGGTSGCEIIQAFGGLGNDLTDVDALLTPLGSYGGPTDTHGLDPASPAVDGVQVCHGPLGGVATDQRGVPRPQFGACDIGAYELACGNGVVDVGETCDDGNQSDGDGCSAACKLEVNSFRCYGGRDQSRAARFEPREVSLAGELADGSAHLVEPWRFCNPVDQDGRGMSDPAGHLACFRFTPSSFTRRTVKVHDQFGDQELALLRRAELCVPSEQDGVSSPLSFDRFTCYKVRTRTGATRFASRRVHLADAFETVDGDIVSPEAFCAPADVDGSGISKPTLHLTCYRILRSTSLLRPVNLLASNQFGDQALRVHLRPSTLCVPSVTVP